jgi:Tfp pilus assembly major pilin PilA
MDQMEMAILVSVLVIVGIRLYQKYAKKGKGVTGTSKTTSSTFPSSSGEDDYEPYSKK